MLSRYLGKVEMFKFQTPSSSGSRGPQGSMEHRRVGIQPEEGRPPWWPALSGGGGFAFWRGWGITGLLTRGRRPQRCRPGREALALQTTRSSRLFSLRPLECAALLQVTVTGDCTDLEQEWQKFDFQSLPLSIPLLGALSSSLKRGK